MIHSPSIETTSDGSHRSAPVVDAASVDGPTASCAQKAVTETDTLIVGAGPQALTVLARWLGDQPARVDSVVVVDPSGSWMQAWDAGFDRQRIEVLRSPGVHHPDPDDMAFVRMHQYCRAHANRPDQADAVAVGPLRRPTTIAFRRFCRDLLQRTGLSDRVVPETVVRIEPCGDARTGVRWLAVLGSGSRVRARQVVWAGNPSVARTPPGVKLCDVIRHSIDVDIATATSGRRVAVLGGGQTAGQLALEAARRGATVTLLTRGEQRVADLDVDAGWLMDDHLEPFRSVTDPAERRLIVEGARRGSMTADLDRALSDAGVCRLSDAGELAAWPEGDGVKVGFAGVECDVDVVWVATGSTPDLRIDPALARLADAGAAHVGGWPILDDNLQWGDGLFVVGALAALTLGPAAGNLGGARAAAEILEAHSPRRVRP